MQTGRGSLYLFKNSCCIAALALIALAGQACSPLSQRSPEYALVKPLAETVSVVSSDDAADDPAIWINEMLPDRSWIAGTDKKAGLYIYDLDGRMLDFAPLGRVNNVDLIGPWSTRGNNEVLAVLTERSQPRLLLVMIEADSGHIQTDGLLSVPFSIGDPYGVCAGMDESEDNISAHAVVTSKEGQLQQYRLALNENEQTTTQLLRTLDVGSTSEGCVIDVASNSLYVAEETVGIWNYPLDPTDNTRTLIATVDGDHLVTDVEGLTIASDEKRGSWLIASSQGDSSFSVFALPSHVYVGSFRIDAHLARGIDRVSGTDGIAAVATDLITDYPGGLFVAQDDVNAPGQTQNFKLVPLADIQAVISDPN